MALTPGTRLGPYEIIAPVGAGGMGEVYRAHDTRLARDVAVKVLPEDLVADDVARERFAREAKAVAALSHPNILSIHDFGESNGVAYAVTELLDGETLAERLLQGAVPLRKTLELASQAAEGLAAAHEQDIVHRDLKPANLFLTRDGRIKILDFGLAKQQQSEEWEEDDTRAVGPATQPGVVMGTVGYMSPEQVRAENADARSDLFSLGVVVYEMLSGNSAFKRDSAAETMSAILHEEPAELSQLALSIPSSVERIVRRCLEKRRAERFQSARDLAFALSNAMEASGRDWSGAAAVQPARGRPLRPGRTPATIAAVVLAAGAGAFVHSRFAASGTPAPVQVKTLTFSGQDWAPSVAPDGKMIAFTSQRDGRPRIWLRQMAGGAEVPLTEGPDHAPKFSPDGTSILFIRDEIQYRSAYRVPVLGGSPRKILEGVAEAAWSPDATRIAYVRYGGEAGTHVVLGVANVHSGETTELAEWSDRTAYGLTWSPTGRWVAAASAGIILNLADNRVLLVDPESGDVVESAQWTRRISAPTWTPSGSALLFAQSTSSLGDMSSTVGRVLRYELGSRKKRTLFWIESVFQGGGDFVRLDVAGTEQLVFDELVTRQNLVEVALPDARFPRGLRGEPRALTRGHCRDRQPAYSPNGEHVVFSSNRSGNLDLWILSTVSGDTRQLTDDESEDWDPAFTPDGRSVLWSSNRGGHLEIWMAAIDGSGARQVTQDGLDAENPTQTPNGDWIVYGSGNPEKSGIWKIRPDGSEATRLVAGAHAIPEISPDGKHVLYATTDPRHNRSIVSVADLDSGTPVFQTVVPERELRSVVVTGRGRWMPDGSALAFIGRDEKGRSGIFVQDFVPGADSESTRRPLYGFSTDEDVESFGISPDGSRVTVSHMKELRSVKIAVGVPGID